MSNLLPLHCVVDTNRPPSMQDLHLIGLPLLSPLAAITLTSFSVTWDSDRFSRQTPRAYETFGKNTTGFLCIHYSMDIINCFMYTKFII